MQYLFLGQFIFRSPFLDKQLVLGMFKLNRKVISKLPVTAESNRV